MYGFYVQIGFEWDYWSVGYGKQCLLVWWCVEVRGLSRFEKGITFWCWRSKEEREVEEDMEQAGWGRKCEDCFEKGRYTLSIKVECWRRSDSCSVEVNLATVICWGYCQILNIGVFLLSVQMYVSMLCIYGEITVSANL